MNTDVLFNPSPNFYPTLNSDRFSTRYNVNWQAYQAGLPPDLQAPVDALAVEVVAGSYTPILVPLVTSYTVAGVVTDATGKPINGARVEAISTTSQARVFSLTNEAGVYYLERLQQGTYTLQVNGKPVEPNSIKIEGSSQSLQELN